MPHLSPLSWALAPILFWSLLLTLSSSIWWSFTPCFPASENNNNSLFTVWNWN